MLKESGGRLLDFASGRVLTMDRRYGWSRREALELPRPPSRRHLVLPSSRSRFELDSCSRLCHRVPVLSVSTELELETRLGLDLIQA